MRSDIRYFFILVVSILIMTLSGCGNNYTDVFPEENLQTRGIQETADPQANLEKKNSGSWTDERLIGHSFGRIGDNTYTGSLEAFQEKYNAGVRVFEVDFATASDGRIVLCHDWSQIVNTDDIPSSEEFKKMKILGEYTPLTFIDLLYLMKEYPDIWIVTDSKEAEYEKVQIEFTEIINEAKEIGLTDMLDRMIVQIYNENMYDAVKEVYPFSDYIFTMYMRWFGEVEEFESLCKWCIMHDIQYITMWNWLYNEEIHTIAEKYGIHIYVHTENDVMAGANYLKSGVDGLYTDDITEEMLTHYSDMVKTIYFAGVNYNATDYVWKGIESPESEFSWTDGDMLYFSVPVQEYEGALKVEMIVCQIFCDIEEYEIIQNDMNISSGTLTAEGTIAFEASAENGFCRFAVKLPNATSIYELYGEGDTRQRALALKQVTLYIE